MPNYIKLLKSEESTKARTINKHKAMELKLKIITLFFTQDIHMMETMELIQMELVTVNNSLWLDSSKKISLINGEKSWMKKFLNIETTITELECVSFTYYFF